ncbi:hypothetical protein [Streptomyces sp. NBC_00162]|uniref:hypothetical protein n=1 Tax=Streptomyces sp. NBC_00162 TaxID=2903629 RepID=UPI00214C43F6|nr:hypothetical protein [Streptomyces sp. NBC_00162]UUU41547.1 hypothetical protein JIW86_23605 [Streptomyces sp. NBC_00162]
MAALVYFRKISEDPELVRYEFGDDPDNFSRQLTMKKGPRVSAADDGLTDYTFLKASRKINAMREEAGRWPERGMSVS